MSLALPGGFQSFCGSSERGAAHRCTLDCRQLARTILSLARSVLRWFPISEKRVLHYFPATSRTNRSSRFRSTLPPSRSLRIVNAPLTWKLSFCVP